MKNRIITEGKEALERTLLMMKYDMKKTLTENVDVISEQKKTNTLTDEDLLGSSGVMSNFLRLISDYNLFDMLGLNSTNVIAGRRSGVKGVVDALDGFVDEKDLAYVSTVLDTLKGKCYYDDVEEKTIPAINRFLELYQEDEGEDLLSDVNSVGTSTLKTGSDKVKKKIAKTIQTLQSQSCDTANVQTNDSSKTNNTETVVKKSDAAIKAFASFSCVSNHPKAKESKMANGSPVFFIDGEVYYNNGRKKDKSGKIVSFTCNDVIFKTSGGKTGVPSITDKNLLSK